MDSFKKHVVLMGIAVFLLNTNTTLVAQQDRRDNWANNWARATERATSQFIQIPGPNPILVPSPSGWDSGAVEAADIIKDNDTYYFYYHATGGGAGYQLGAATSDHPLGPWKKYEDNPILKVGPAKNPAPCRST